jgi:hypothetical protein
MPYALLDDGDHYEKAYYGLFLHDEFPAYEQFWNAFVTPLTNRPDDVHFKTDAQLAAIGRLPEEICIAQLNYSVFRHLVRVYDIRVAPPVSVDGLYAGMSALVGAQDTAFEVLERFRHLGRYDPWLAKRDKQVKGGPKGGQEAQNAWKKRNNYPLQDIRDYRNNLMHGRTMPGISINGSPRFPLIGQEQQYLDWRRLTGLPINALPLHDLAEPSDILNGAWNCTVAYIQAQWTTELLPHV